MSAFNAARRTAPLVRLLAIAVVAAVVALPPADAVSSLPCLRPPVVAAIADPYRPPACTWCPGNRGIEYATRAGTVVRAAGAGTVTFAGKVAGTLWVTLAHPAGVLTSYGPLAQIDVRREERVAVGQPVGAAAGRLHLGVRIDGSYVDPALLLGVAPHLVPRLVRLDGRIPPPPLLRCPAGPAASPSSPGTGWRRAGLLAWLTVPSASLASRSESVPESIMMRPILPAVARR